MKIFSLYTRVGLILGALLLCFSMSAHAGWVLYDDFSDTDWSDKWGFGSEGANADLSWTQSGGVLKVDKVAGTSAISKANGNECRFIPLNFPSNANGIRYDIRITNATGVNSTDEMICISRVRTDGYPFVFSGETEAKAIERYTDIEIDAYTLSTKPGISFGQEAMYEAKDGSREDVLHSSRGWMEVEDPLGIWTKITMMHGDWAGFMDLNMDTITKQHQYSRTKLPYGGEVSPNPYFILLRVHYAAADVTFNIEIDDVYYHTGDFEPEPEQVTVKTAVIPIF